MSKKERKRKEQFHNNLEMSRRAFLGGTAGVMAASTVALTVPAKTAIAGPPTVITPHRHNPFGSASVRFVPTTEQNLGTSRIYGPIKRPSELDTGFNRAHQGHWGKDEGLKRTRFIAKHPLGAALSSTLMLMSTDPAVGAFADPAPNKLPIPDPERMSKHIKELAYFLRADDVGIGDIRHEGTYTERFRATPNNDGWFDFTSIVEDNSHHKYAIALLVDQDLRTFMGSTGYDGISGSQSFRSYLLTGYISVVMANYIRRLGYSARAHHARNYNQAVGPNLISAGMGEMSRMQDSVLHPRLGFRHKAAVVTTDMPLKVDLPIDFGGSEFCRVCRKCAEHCPVNAVSTNKEQNQYNGYYRWCSDMEKCTLFRIGNEDGSSCGRCVKVCPWNSKGDSWFHSAGVQMVSRFPSLSPILRDIDDIFGYGTEEVKEFKWWLEWPELYKYNF